MSESALWKDMKKNIGHLGHFSRVESHETSSGIPDVDFCINGTEGHIELKFSRDKTPKIRSSQVTWFRRRRKEGGNPWLFTHMILKGKDYYLLHDASKISGLATNRNVADWITASIFRWISYMDWKELVECITVNKSN